jgi:hypothetical protein
MPNPSPQRGFIDKFFGFRFIEATVPSGSIAFQLDEYRSVKQILTEVDMFSGEITERTIEVVSGGGPKYLTWCDEHVPHSGMCLRRASSPSCVLSREREAYFRAVGEEPGDVLALCDDEAQIISGWALNRDAWELARRAAAKFEEHSFLLTPPYETKHFKFRGGKGSTGWWSWAAGMRAIVDGDPAHENADELRPFGRGCGLVGSRCCRPVQNLHELPSLEECARSLKCPTHWNASPAGQAMKYAFAADCKARSEALPGGAAMYQDTGTLNPSLLPNSDADWTSPVRKPI